MLFSRLWTKVDKTLRQCRGPFVLCNDLAQLSMAPVSFRRHSLLSLEVWKPHKCTFSGSQCLWGTTPTFLRHIVSAIYHSPFGEVWLSFICWCPSAKPGNEIECRIYGGWVKCTFNFKPFMDQSSCRFETIYRRPLVVSKHLPAYVYHVSFRRYRPLKLRCHEVAKSSKKGVFLFLVAKKRKKEKESR